MALEGIRILKQIIGIGLFVSTVYAEALTSGVASAYL